MPVRKTEEKSSWPLVGNSHIIDFLSKSIANDKIASAYIFFGPQDLGKTTVANYFAKSLLCQNKFKSQDKGIILPCGQCISCQAFVKTLVKAEEGKEKVSDPSVAHGDFHFLKIDEGKKNISIEQIREFVKDLGLSSFLGFYKIGVIKEADNLSIEAANALLKILEEPKEKVVIILTTNNLEAIPSTIISRSQVLNFYPVKTDLIYDYLVKEKKFSRSMAKNLSRICLGRPALAVKFLEDGDFYKDYLMKVNVFLDFSEQNINERLAGVEKLMGFNVYGQAGSQAALKIIEIWQGLVRDLLFLDFGHRDLIQHQIVEEDLLKKRSGFGSGAKSFLKITRNLQKGKQYLRANVNPKLVLENIAINI